MQGVQKHCLSSKPVLLLTAFFCLVFAINQTVAQAQHFTIRPSIAVSEEYSDNVNQDREELSEFTTSIRPGLELTYLMPRLDVSVRYGFEYLYYAKGNYRDGDDLVDHDTRHTLDASALATLIRNLFYLEVGNTYERVDTNLLRSETFAGLPGDDSDVASPPGTDDRTAPNRDTTDRNNFFISPYFEFEPFARTTLRSGYRYDNTWYSEDNQENMEEHLAFLDGMYAWTPRWTLQAGYNTTWVRPEDDFRTVEGIDFNSNERETRHIVYAGPRYRYAENSEVYALIGNTWRRFQESANQTDLYWHVGLSHSFAPYVASLETGRQYSYDSSVGRSRQESFYTASLSRAHARGVVMLIGSYIELDEPKEEAYRGGITGDYALTRRLTADAGLFAERREESEFIQGNGDGQGVVREWTTLLGLNYLLGPDFTLSLSYRFIDSSSNSLSDEDFQENRVRLEIRKVF